MHGLALSTCLQTLKSDLFERDALREYAQTYWPLHCEDIRVQGPTGLLKDQINVFLYQGCEASVHFADWIDKYNAKSLEVPEDLYRKIQAAASIPASPLFVACVFDLPWIIDGLSNYSSFDWCRQRMDGDVGFILAATFGQRVVVERLLDLGVPVDTKRSRGETALHRAYVHGHVAVVVLLLSHNADINAASDSGAAALHGTASSLFLGTTVLELLLKQNADLNTCDLSGDTPLLTAAAWGNKPAAKLLYEKARAQGTTNGSILCSAVRGGSLELVKSFIDWGTDVNTLTRVGNRLWITLSK